MNPEIVQNFSETDVVFKWIHLFSNTQNYWHLPFFQTFELKERLVCTSCRLIVLKNLRIFISIAKIVPRCEYTILVLSFWLNNIDNQLTAWHKWMNFRQLIRSLVNNRSTFSRQTNEIESNDSIKINQSKYLISVWGVSIGLQVSRMLLNFLQKKSKLNSIDQIMNENILFIFKSSKVLFISHRNVLPRI